MDWNLAIEINRAALKRVLAMLVAMAGLPALAPDSEAASRPTLPRHLHRAVLRLLRPAEAAARRLVIAAAACVVAPVSRAGQSGPQGTGRKATMSRGTPPARSHGFPLLDPLPRFRPRRPVPGSMPRISLPGFTRPSPLPPPPGPDDPVDATRLALRLQTLGHALDDLPGHAGRFLRWRGSHLAVPHNEPATGGTPVVRRWPLRMGRPPGWRRKARHEVHAILLRTNGLALYALEGHDTS